MKAVLFDHHGGPDVLHYAEATDPVPTPDEVLIRVRAVGVNPADGKWRSGLFEGLAPVSFPHIGGYDVAGIVESGDAFPAGTRVIAMVDTFRAGAYAELTVTTPDRMARLPDGVDFVTGSTLPTPGLTGFQLIDEGLEVQASHRVLITGTLGAVGRFALYAAKMRGATVVAAVRAAARDAVFALGADEAIVIGEDYDGAPFDRIADTVGGDGVASLCRHVVPGAVLKTVATTLIPPAGLPAESGFFIVHPDPAQLRRVVASIATGQIAVAVVDRLPLSSAAEAQARVDAGGNGGRIVLEL